MNDIKFRAWDKIQNVMFNFDIYNVPPYVGHTYLEGEKFERIYEIMQYTGLKDRNGTDIYEGDILNGVYYGETELKEKIKGDVYYTNRGTWDCCSFLLGGLNETCEVIGNIYENSELLGDSQ